MDSLLSLIDSSSTLCQHLTSSLSLPSSQTAAATATAQASNNDTPPLALLSDAALFLRSHTTKFSLLAINSPFTPSALHTVLQEMTGSALPGLVTAALLIGEASYPPAFFDEAKFLVKNALQEFTALTSTVKVVAESQNGSTAAPDKESVTVTAGRVWAACDALTSFANGGVVGFVMAKAKVYLELVKDGIRELEEWDPEDDDEDDFFDTGFEHDDDEENNNNNDLPQGRGNKSSDAPDLVSDDDDDDEEDANTQQLLNRKEHMLRILKSIVKIYPAIETYRLKPLAKQYPSPRVSLPQSYTSKMTSLLASFRSLPDYVDEATGCLYESDLDNSTKNLAKVISCSKKAVNLVRDSCETRDGEKEEAPTEDKFVKWADTFFKVLGGMETSA